MTALGAAGPFVRCEDCAHWYAQRIGHLCIATPPSRHEERHVDLSRAELRRMLQALDKRRREAVVVTRIVGVG